MKENLLARLLNWKTTPLIPRFRYEYFVDSKDLQKSFACMKEVFQDRGGRITSEASGSLTAEISAAKMVRSMMALPDTLKIEMNAAGADRIKVTVTSLGERKLYLSFFAISVVISILGILKKGELFALIFPLGTYGIVLQHSVYPQHPAHKKLREVLRDSDQDSDHESSDE